MATPLTERPQQPAPEIRSLPKGVRHAVGANESWASLAQSRGIDAWDLIEFNFPGVKQVKQADTERATRQVNWYLSQYVGCHASNDGGRNYHQALQNWLNRNRAAVGRLWTIHFTGAADPDNSSVNSWSMGVQTSIETGVTAHVRGDMPIALERAYHSYTAKYCLDPLPVFDQFRADFFAMGTVFDRARKILLSHVAQMGPVPEAAVAVGEKLFSRIDSNVVDGWRKEAWAEAERRIDRAKLRSHGSFPVPAAASTP